MTEAREAQKENTQSLQDWGRGKERGKERGAGKTDNNAGAFFTIPG